MESTSMSPYSWIISSQQRNHRGISTPSSTAWLISSIEVQDRMKHVAYHHLLWAQERDGYKALPNLVKPSYCPLFCPGNPCMCLWCFHSCYVPSAWYQCCALGSTLSCTEAPIVHIYESNCASLHTLQNTQVFQDLVSVYPAYQQFVRRLDASAVPLWQECPSRMCSALVWSYASGATSVYDNRSSWSCLHTLDRNNLCPNHIVDMSILRECANQQKWCMPWNHGLTTSKRLQG
jgi:hypothetical protein